MSADYLKEVRELWSKGHSLAGIERELGVVLKIYTETGSLDEAILGEPPAVEIIKVFPRRNWVHPLDIKKG